jgi:hypothetical protein
LLLGGIERADAGGAGDREGDVGALVVLGQGQLLAERRVAEGVGVGDDHLGLGVDRRDAGLEPDRVADHGRDGDAADDADGVGLGHQAGDDAGQECPLVLAEGDAGDVGRLGDGVDQEEVVVRVLVGDLGDRLGQEEADADGEVALLGGLGQVGDVGGGVAALDDAGVDPEFGGGAVEAALGEVVEVLVAEAGGVGHHGDDDRLLGAQAADDHAAEGRGERRGGGHLKDGAAGRGRGGRGLKPGRHGRLPCFLPAADVVSAVSPGRDSAPWGDRRMVAGLGARQMARAIVARPLVMNGSRLVRSGANAKPFA